MAKEKPVYKVKSIRQSRFGAARETVLTGTIAELVQSYSYTLECGASYEREKGNSKINCNPKNIKSLITNLNNAKNNSAANGCSDTRYVLVED